jgi:hypothetical protein
VKPGDTVPVIFFRKSQRPGTKANDYSVGVFASSNNALTDQMIESLSQVFSATAIIPRAPSDSSSNDLQNLADSYSFKSINEDQKGNLVQIFNQIWSVRSFLNQSDYYYVLQEVDYRNAVGSPAIIDFTASNITSPGITPDLIRTSPASTQCSQSTTSGITWSAGGSAGYNQKQGFNATLTGGVSVTNSKTITCPSTTIINSGNPGSGQTQWQYRFATDGANLATFYNQWIWEVPFSAYQKGQSTIAAQSHALQYSVFGGDIATNLSLSVPLPFGQTFALQKPVVTSVSPTCVNAGNVFDISGSGMYPSLVSSVLIDGIPLTSSQYKVNSDSDIQVAAPVQSGDDQPVVVQTGVGTSNSNVGIEISTLGLCGSNSSKR